jgi:hypothetical protein
MSLQQAPKTQDAGAASASPTPNRDPNYIPDGEKKLRATGARSRDALSTTGNPAVVPTAAAAAAAADAASPSVLVETALSAIRATTDCEDREMSMSTFGVESQVSTNTVVELAYIHSTKANPTSNVTQCLTDIADASLEKTLRLYLLAEASKAWSIEKGSDFETYNASDDDPRSLLTMERELEKQKGVLFDGLNLIRRVEKQKQKAASDKETDEGKKRAIFEKAVPVMGQIIGAECRKHLTDYATDFVKHWDAKVKTQQDNESSEACLRKINSILKKTGQNIDMTGNAGRITDIGQSAIKARHETGYDTNAKKPLPELLDGDLQVESSDFEEDEGNADRLSSPEVPTPGKNKRGRGSQSSPDVTPQKQKGESGQESPSTRKKSRKQPRRNI